MERRYFTPIMGILWWIEESPSLNLNLGGFIIRYLTIFTVSVLAPTIALALLIRLIDSL